MRVKTKPRVGTAILTETDQIPENYARAGSWETFPDTLQSIRDTQYPNAALATTSELAYIPKTRRITFGLSSLKGFGPSLVSTGPTLSALDISESVAVSPSASVSPSANAESYYVVDTLERASVSPSVSPSVLKQTGKAVTTKEAYKIAMESLHELKREWQDYVKNEAEFENYLSPDIDDL